MAFVGAVQNAPPGCMIVVDGQGNGHRAAALPFGATRRRL
jgi:hypothetical protein